MLNTIYSAPSLSGKPIPPAVSQNVNYNDQSRVEEKNEIGLALHMIQALIAKIQSTPISAEQAKTSYRKIMLLAGIHRLRTRPDVRKALRTLEGLYLKHFGSLLLATDTVGLSQVNTIV